VGAIVFGGPHTALLQEIEMARWRVRKGFQYTDKATGAIYMPGKIFEATDEEIKGQESQLELAGATPQPEPEKVAQPLPRRARGRPRKVRFATPPETTAMG